MKDINFLVEDNPFENELQEEKEKSVPVAKKIVTVLIITIGILILLVPGIYVKSLDKKAISIENSLTDERFKEVRTVKAQLSEVTNKVSSKKAIINGIDYEYISASQTLLIVENALPSGCYLKSLNFNGNSISINGIAESSFIASDFWANMDRLQLFKGSPQGFSMEETQSAVDFSMTYSR